MGIYISMCMYGHMYTCTYVYEIYTTYVCMFVCMYAYMYKWMNICMNIYETIKLILVESMTYVHIYNFLQKSNSNLINIYLGFWCLASSRSWSCRRQESSFVFDLSLQYLQHLDPWECHQQLPSSSYWRDYPCLLRLLLHFIFHCTSLQCTPHSAHEEWWQTKECK